MRVNGDLEFFGWYLIYFHKRYDPEMTVTSVEEGKRSLVRFEVFAVANQHAELLA